MNHRDIVNAILWIYPDAKFRLKGTDLDWLDEVNPKPSLEQIKEADVAFRLEKTRLETEAQAKREAALSKLEALGLTADDLKALGL